MSYSVDELQALIHKPHVDQHEIQQQLADYQAYHKAELQKINALMRFNCTMIKRKHKLELIFAS